MDCRYTIQFFNEWHCGSGLAAGADIDLLVVKDKQDLPFVPGKTVKGLVREAIEVLCQLGECDENVICQLFGKPGDKQENLTHQGMCVFSNATLHDDVSSAIASNGLSQHLYRNVSSTAIDDDGVAKEHSLRNVEVVVPCTVEGRVYNVPQEHYELLRRAFAMIKRMGQSRNRGYGRCDMKLMKIVKS